MQITQINFPNHQNTEIHQKKYNPTSFSSLLRSIFILALLSHIPSRVEANYNYDSTDLQCSSENISALFNTRVLDKSTVNSFSVPTEITIELHSQIPIHPLALTASTLEQAQEALQKSGYDIGDKELIRKLNPTTGEGFWDKTINDCRMISYGPGEYVHPHYHDIDETFDVKTGGCHLWTSYNEGLSWEYRYCGQGELRILGGSWHALIAGQEGLCMDVYKDSKRTINWLDAHHSSSWSSTLRYTTTIQELKDATELVLKK